MSTAIRLINSKVETSYFIGFVTAEDEIKNFSFVLTQVSYQGAKLWNGFSKKTKNTSTLKDFMKAIK